MSFRDQHETDGKQNPAIANLFEITGEANKLECHNFTAVTH